MSARCYACDKMITQHTYASSYTSVLDRKDLEPTIVDEYLEILTKPDSYVRSQVPSS
jgi:hypothetical protein